MSHFMPDHGLESQKISKRILFYRIRSRTTPSYSKLLPLSTSMPSKVWLPDTQILHMSTLSVTPLPKGCGLGRRSLHLIPLPTRNRIGRFRIKRRSTLFGCIGMKRSQLNVSPPLSVASFSLECTVHLLGSFQNLTLQNSVS